MAHLYNHNHQTIITTATTLQVLDVWVFGEIWCRGWLVTDVWISTASILNLCAISIDRYVAVTRPVKYRSIMTNRRAKCIVAIVWILAFIICLPPLLTEWSPSGPTGVIPPPSTSSLSSSLPSSHSSSNGQDDSRYHPLRPDGGSGSSSVGGREQRDPHKQQGDLFFASLPSSLSPSSIGEFAASCAALSDQTTTTTNPQNSNQFSGADH